MKIKVPKIFRNINFWVIAILLLGAFLRFYNLGTRTYFDADQEWMAFRSRDLLNGDLALIGPVTSIGSFSIGPGFIYLNSIFSFIFSKNPISGSILSVLLGLLTCLSLYLFAKNFVNQKFALILLFLVSTSWMFINWDQIPWTPSLFYLAQVIVLAGAYLASIKKDFGWVLLTFGFVVGFQAHVGIIISIFCAFIYLFITRSKIPKIKYVIYSIVVLLFGLLPNIVFDVFNNFVNFQRFMSIFSDTNNNYLSFSKVIGAMARSTSSIIYPRQINAIDTVITRVILAAAIANGLSMLFDKKLRKLSLLFLITAIVPPALFYLQQGKFSEYYIMMSVPSLLFLTMFLVYKVFSNKYLLFVILLVTTIINYTYWKKLDRNLTLQHKINIVSKIVEMGGKEGYGVSLTTAPGMNFGYNYLFDYYKAKPNLPPLKDQKKIFTILVPDGFDGIQGIKDFGGIGLLWQGI